MIPDNITYLVLQLLILILSGIVVAGTKHILKKITDMDTLFLQLNERFKMYVQKETCEVHRRDIEMRIKDAEMRVTSMLESMKHNDK